MPLKVRAEGIPGAGSHGWAPLKSPHGPCHPPRKPHPPWGVLWVGTARAALVTHMAPLGLQGLCAPLTDLLRGRCLHFGDMVQAGE